MKKPVFTWDEEKGVAECSLWYAGIEFHDFAMCHDEDMDMCNKLTGQTIAELRALIQVYQYHRDCELKPQLQALKQLYYSMNKSKQYNKKSYEARMLYRHITMYEEELQAVREEIKKLREHLNFYINEKEKFYQSVRKERAAKTN